MVQISSNRSQLFAVLRSLTSQDFIPQFCWWVIRIAVKLIGICFSHLLFVEQLVRCCTLLLGWCIFLQFHYHVAVGCVWSLESCSLMWLFDVTVRIAHLHHHALFTEDFSWQSPTGGMALKPGTGSNLRLSFFVAFLSFVWISLAAWLAMIKQMLRAGELSAHNVSGLGCSNATRNRWHLKLIPTH